MCSLGSNTLTGFWKNIGLLEIEIIIFVLINWSEFFKSITSADLSEMSKYQSMP